MAGQRRCRASSDYSFGSLLLALALSLASFLGGEAFAVLPSAVARARALTKNAAIATGGVDDRRGGRVGRRSRGGGRVGSSVGASAAEASAAEAMSGTAAAPPPGSETTPDAPTGEERSSPTPDTPRMLGGVAEEGFSGTRRGFQVQKEYAVPEEAPTNLPEGEDEGYPMLIYQFMHAQYRDDFPSVSSARKAVRREELLLNGTEVRNDSKVNPGDTVTMQKRTQPGLFPQGKPSCTLPILWEDDFIAVIIKPAGVAVHGGTGEDDPGPGGRRSVRQALPYMLTPTKSEDRPLHRPLHCHRLDKATGGLLICAKTRPALSAVGDAFEQRLVSKRYVALVAGELEGSGAIVTPLDGKACLTNYRVRGPPVRSLKTSVITTVDLWPVTGRLHQLRRHLLSIGCPILGDRRYTPDEVPFQEGGMYLQAVGLTFPHPITGEEMNFSIPEPAKFEKWREKEHQRWLQHDTGSGSTGDGDVSADVDGADAQGGEEKKKPSVNAVPEVEGLQIEERDGFRYYQYDWSVVGGKPTALSTDDIDAALDGAP
ncbi:unnamed protein product [Ectocarpus sp. 6 AP-2014]